MYDHHKKAGNQGDVVKHPALVAAVDTVLQRSNTKVFHVLDTFAGYAHNPIVKGNEWQNGIGHIHRRGRSTDNSHVIAWMSLWQLGTQLIGNAYPGSSLYMLKTCQDRGVSFCGSLWDISPSVVAQLMTVYAQLDIQVNGRPATYDDLQQQTVDFVFIDPPGIRSPTNPSYPTIDDLTAFAVGKHHVMVWLPMVADLSTTPPFESENSTSWRQSFTRRGLSATTVRWNAGGPICGCQLLYRIPNDATTAVRAAIEATLALTKWATKTVEHFDPSEGN